MEKNPLVSVVVPTHNRKKRLVECVRSLFRQDYPAALMEVIVVDDCSTDGTAEILESIASEAPFEFRFLTVQRGGSYAARNRGVEQSSGEIVCFLDDDCVAEKDWASKLASGFKDPLIGGVGGRIEAVKRDSLMERYTEDIHILDQESWWKTGMLVTANVAYLKRALEETGGFDEKFRSGGDTDLSIRVQLAGYKLRYSPDARVYHNHPVKLKSFLKRQFRYGTGYAMFSSKYEKNFSIKFILIDYKLKAACILLRYPVTVVRALGSGDRTYLLLKPLLDVARFAAFTSGIVAGSIKTLLMPYNGEKVSEKVGFVREESFNELFGKVKRKIF